MATYYVKNGGSDAATGLSDALAWETIDKVNGSSFSAGDSILFKRDSTWREQLTVPSSGSAGLPITFGAYGSGADPVITGSDLITPGTSWGPGGSWDAVFSDSAGADNNGTVHLRACVPADVGSVSGTKVRVTVMAHSTTDLTLVGCSIGEATTGAVFDATPTRITFGSNNGITVTHGTTAVSDEITFTFDKTKRYLVHFDFYGAASGKTKDTSVNHNYHTFWDWTTASDSTLATAYTTNSDQVITTCLSKLEIYGGVANVWQTTVTTEPKIVFFDGARGIKETSVANLSVATEWFWAANVLYVYSTSDPDAAYTDPGIEIGARDHVISIVNENYVTATGFDLKGTNSHILEISGSAAYNIVSNCDLSYNGAGMGLIVWITGGEGANTVDSSSIHDIAEQGVTWYDLYSGSGTKSYIKNCTVYNTVSFGLYLKANYLIVEENLVYDCGTTDTPGWGIGIQCEASDSGTGQYCIVRYNRIYGTRGDDVDGTGIQLDHWTAYNQVYGNVVSGCDGQGIVVYNSHDNVVYNNSSYGNVQRSTFSNGRFEIGVVASGGSLSYNDVVKNNVAQATTANTYAIYVDANSYSQAGLSISNNCWYAAATNWYFWNATGGNNLATWNALTGVGTDLNSDPLFTNAAGGDFTLTAPSPCIDAGVDLGNDYAQALLPASSWPRGVITGDQYGRGAGWDIGAYLYDVYAVGWTGWMGHGGWF